MGSVKVVDAKSAARAAISRLVLSANSGYNSADRQECLQVASIAAAKAAQKFDDLGLEPTASGKAGYMVLSARRGSLDWIKKNALLRSRETCTDFSDPESQCHANNCRSIEQLERRSVVAAVLTEVQDVIGGDHAAVAKALLDHRSAAHTAGVRPMEVVAAMLQKSSNEIYRIVDELAAYFAARSGQYTGC